MIWLVNIALVAKNCISIRARPSYGSTELARHEPSKPSAILARNLRNAAFVAFRHGLLF